MITKKHLLDLYLELDEKVYMLEEKVSKLSVDLAYKKLLEKPVKRKVGRPRKNTK